jgi:hemoglobin
MTSSTSSTSPLYEALGGEDGIRGAVQGFYERVLADPDLAPYFAGVDMESLQRHQTDMLVTATGGPRQYNGQDMAEAHSGLDITEDAFDKVVGHLGATLKAAGADDDSIGAVVAALSPLRSSIVSA